ncbi:MAG: hypothetical protein AUI11_10630 [Acidobacteria bacterium 13_2_20CM_2_66_4]|nr:MAG: hypothetical protein AUI11_10630 [Acidobacteria bacterium 13_2_20CM_2_66_4]
MFHVALGRNGPAYCAVARLVKKPKESDGIDLEVAVTRQRDRLIGSRTEDEKKTSAIMQLI